MRKFLILIALLFGVGFFISHLADMEQAGATLLRGDWRYIVLGILLQMTWLLNIAASYRAIYRALNVEEDIKYLTLQATAANFVNVVTPTSGVGGLTFFVADGMKRGHSPARATLAGALFVLFEYAGFLCVMAIGIIVLIRRNNLSFPEVGASVFLLTLTLLLGFLLYQGMKSTESWGIRWPGWRAWATGWRARFGTICLSRRNGHTSSPKTPRWVCARSAMNRRICYGPPRSL